LRKILPAMVLDVIDIEELYIPAVALMKIDHDGNNFAV